MISKKKFKQLVEKNLHVLEGYEIDKNGNIKMHIVGIEKLYKQLNIADVSQQLELLNAYDEKMASKHMFFMPTPKESKDEFLEAFNCT